MVLCLLNDTKLEEGEVQEVVGLTYLLVQILVRLRRQDQPIKSVVSDFFDLPNKLWFAVEEFDLDFLDYMLINMRDQRLALEDDIVDIVTNMRRHRYGDTLRM